MKLRLVSLFFLLLIIGSTTVVEAQSRKYKRRRSTNKAVSTYVGQSHGVFKPYYFGTFNINALNYFGDLAPLNQAASTDISFTRPGFGGSFGYRFNANMAVRGGISWGRIKGDDFTSDPDNESSSPRYARNLSFRNDIKELKVGLEYYIIKSRGSYSSRPRINGYVFVGVAVFHHSPKGKVPQFDYQANDNSTPLSQAGEWIKLQPLGTEGQFLAGNPVKPYGQFQLSIPLAIGIRASLPGPFDAGLEFGYRFLFTDYIDDVSGTYVNLDKFEDPYARIMSDRSAEPVAVWDDINRVNDLPLSTRVFPNGESYTINASNGTGFDGSVRGNPDQKDMIFMTSIKITYLLYPKSAISSKVR